MSAQDGRRVRSGITAELGPLVLSASVSVALARLIEHGLGLRVLVPVLASILVGDGATATVTRMFRLRWAMGIGLVLSLLVLILCVDPAVFVPGAAHFLNGSVLSSQYRAAQFALVHEGTPLPLLNGVVVGIGALGAVTSVITRGLWARRQAPVRRRRRFDGLAVCIAPTFAVFIYSTLVSANRDRVPAAVAYFFGVLVVVAVADRRAISGPPLRSWRIDVTTVLSCLVALGVVIGVGVGLSNMRLTVFHVTPPKPLATLNPKDLNGSGSNVLTGLELLDNLRTVELQATDDVVFRATSPIATYWQVGTLSTFNGTEWLPTPGVDAALSGSASAQSSALAPSSLPSPDPSSFPNFTARFDISDFFSRLLPAPPHAVSVSGLPGAKAIGQEGVLAAQPSQAGTTYGVMSWLSTSSSVDGPQLSTSDPRLAPYLALPSQPAVVAQLAHQAVGNLTSPPFEVQALINWFRSGQFRYTLTPPPTTGPDPLVQFLTVTKAGYCQQFAGAFGVLARSLGIPTRLVVGFIAGRSGPNQTFTVTGADAHVWPQVYLGPEAGWVSVEPTPSSPVGSAVPLGVLEPSTASSGTGTGTTPSSVPAQGGFATPTTPTGGASGTSKSSGHHRPAPAPHRHGSGFLLPFIVLVALVLLALIGLRELRRRREIALRKLGSDTQVVRAWERAITSLQRQGMSRRAGETPYEYVARVSQVSVASNRQVDVTSLSLLAELVEQACYTPHPCTPQQAGDAWRLAIMVAGPPRSHRRTSRRVPHEA
jgi:transglutaminase-like putative cysteine protease